MSWRNCKASDKLAVELDELWPDRDTASDGTVGNAAHVSAGWTSSDHNPWVQVAGVGIVRARDVDKDGIDVAWLAEWLRLKGLAGDPRLAGGGYVIWNGRITTSDFKGWKPYTGLNAHKEHVHVSFSRNPAGFDSTAAWNLAEEYLMSIASIEAKLDALVAALAPIERFGPDGKTVVKIPVRQEIADIRTTQLSQLGK